MSFSLWIHPSRTNVCAFFPRCRRLHLRGWEWTRQRAGCATALSPSLPAPVCPSDIFNHRSFKSNYVYKCQINLFTNTNSIIGFRGHFATALILIAPLCRSASIFLVFTMRVVVDGWPKTRNPPFLMVFLGNFSTEPNNGDVPGSLTSHVQKWRPLLIFSSLIPNNNTDNNNNRANDFQHR